MDEYITRNNAISAVCLGCNQQFSDEPCEPSDCTIRRSIMALPAADVAPRAEGGAECPICHGTGRIGTTDWLTKHLSEKQLAEEKSKAIAEHEQHIKAEVAREIFEELTKSVISKLPMKIRLIFKDDRNYDDGFRDGKGDALIEVLVLIDELKKKYTEGQK